MKTLLLSLFALGAALVAGCSSPSGVVTTEIAIDKSDGTLRVSSPKNIAIKGLSVAVKNDGEQTITLDEYTSTADPGAVEAVKAQYAALGELSKSAAESAKAIK